MTRSRPGPSWLLAMVALAAGLAGSAGSGFTPLHDGETLAGWTRCAGRAGFRVEDGAIVGTAIAEKANSFLCTDREYGDFVLELEFRVDEGLNSGVQIRSHVAERDHVVRWITPAGEPTEQKIRAGRVYGYQVEIDPSERAWSGGIYDEGRRGWLASLEGNPAARRAFRAGAWNRLRVEARGDRLRTWINEVPATDLRDAMTPRGFVALQVHGVAHEPELAGRQVRWRRLRIRALAP